MGMSIWQHFGSSWQVLAAFGSFGQSLESFGSHCDCLQLVETCVAACCFDLSALSSNVLLVFAMSSWASTTAKPGRYPFRYHPKHGILMDVALRLSSLMRLSVLANVRFAARATLICLAIFVFDFARPFEMVVRF